MGGTVHHRDRSTELEGKEVSFGMSAGNTSKLRGSHAKSWKGRLMMDALSRSRKARLLGSQDCRRHGRTACARQELPQQQTAAVSSCE